MPNGDVKRLCLIYKIENNELNIPDPRPLLFGQLRMPYAFIGDGTFTLKTYMMKPYLQRYFTPEKRAHISENLFYILANRWRVFPSVLNLGPEKAITITTYMCFISS